MSKTYYTGFFPNEDAVGAKGSAAFLQYTAELSIYIRSLAAPLLPTGGSYSFIEGLLTPPTDWSSSIPAGADPVWVSYARLTTYNRKDLITTIEWSTPVELFKTADDPITVRITNPTVIVPADSNGQNQVVTNSGTAIYVYEGDTLLEYDGVGGSESRWRIDERIAENINIGTIAADSVSYAIINDIQSMSGDKGSVRYIIKGFNKKGTSFSIEVAQNFTRLDGITIDTTPPVMPTGLVVTTRLDTLPGGELQPVLIADWNTNTDVDLAYYEVEIKESSSTSYINFQTASNSYEWKVLGNIAYDVRVRAVDKSNNKGAYLSVNNTISATGTVDHAGLINSGTTSINANKINISGSTYLSNWRNGTDNTKIEGGSIAANTITANKLTIGARGIDISGLEFQAQKTATNRLDWTAGTIVYTNDAGNVTTTSITASNATWSSGVLYIYWIKGGTSLSSSTATGDAYGADKIVLATYMGGTNLIVNYGRTIIDGSQITTGTLSADKLLANTTLTSNLQVGSSNFRIDGAAQGAGKGTLIVSNGTADLIKLGYITSSTVGFQLYNASGETLLSSTTPASSITNSSISISSNGILSGGGGGQVTISGLGYTGDLNATVGAPAGTLVAGVDASTVATATTNFNSSNDRNSTAVTAPTIATDGTAVDHALQTNGSTDISFEWGWSGTEGDIDGFLVYVYQSSSATAYTFGTTPAAETVYTIPASKRAFILYGVTPDLYYSFAVQAYRSVDKDINSAGAIKSTIVKATGSGENPYRPSTTVAFAGNVTGTINSIAAANVNVWNSISGAGKPADNANNTYVDGSGNIQGVSSGANTAVANSNITISSNGTINNAGGGQVTIGGLGYTGDLNATVGAPAGTFVSGVSASTVATATTNFNSSNDRNSTAVTAPTIATDGTAVDHSIQTNGSADISFEWSWGGSEGDIDGFLVYVYQSSSATAYTFGTTPAAETVYTVPANKRAFILYGVTPDLYYSFAVQAYRSVDKDINSAGAIKSTLVKATGSGENPYRPSTTVAFAGNVTGTINNIAAANVNVWSSISGTGKPADNATVGAPAGTLVAGVDASTVATATTNFNSSNDRNSTAVTAPTIATDGTAVDHALQTNGSTDISFEWGWSGSEGDIDGFLVYVYQSSSATAYTFGTTPAAETVYTVPANKRAFILYGVTPDLYYSFAVQAYRSVDKDVNSAGAIKSTIVKATGSGENPYRPSATVAFAGNVTGTINNIAAANVNVWSSISGTGKPADNATVGAPAGTLVAGVDASTVATATTNFNSSNDRNSAAVTAPTIATDGTAVDHTTQTNGSADISFEWGWSGAEGDIDGFLVYVYQSSSATAYTFGTTPAAETVYTVPANKRAFILYGVAPNLYYSFAVQAYRSVDKDINSAGAIKSTLVKATGSGENPYRPETSVAFAGNVTGTINSIAAANVNVWSSISGTGKPADNANNTYVDGSGNIQGVSSGSGTGVANSNITVSSNGTINNAGGGQVTIGGLGYTGDLNATRNLISSGLFSGRPTGLNGDLYYATDTGVLYQKVSGSWVSGATTNYVSSGTLASRPTGANGDFYYATDTQILYQKINGSWSAGASYGATIGSNLSGTFTESNISSNFASNSIPSTYIKDLAANKISAGTVSVGVSVGDNKVKLDGANRQITIRDTNNVVRVKIGDLSV